MWIQAATTMGTYQAVVGYGAGIGAAHHGGAVGADTGVGEALTGTAAATRHASRGSALR